MESKRSIVALVLAIHVCLVPLVVLATNWILGFQDALTPANQRTWTPIIAAQSILLSTYLGFGTGPACRRVISFLIGCFSLCAIGVVAYSMLCTLPEPKWTTFVLQLRTNSLWVLIPPITSGLLMMLVRPWFGELRHASDVVSNLQFSLLDMFVVISLVGVAVAWCNYVANIRVEASNANRIADVIPISPLLQTALWRTGMVMSAAWALFSYRGWGVGLLLFLALIAMQNHDFSSGSFWYVVYTWAVVLCTLGVFRISGYRLLGRTPGAVVAAT